MVTANIINKLSKPEVRIQKLAKLRNSTFFAMLMTFTYFPSCVFFQNFEYRLYLQY